MKRLITLSIFLLLGTVSISHAATVFVSGKVKQTVVAGSDGLWGSCMAEIDQTLSGFGLDCPGGWVSFSCSGVFAGKDVAYRMFDSAQMAQALDKTLTVRVDDLKKHNGHCFGDIVVVKP